MISTRSHGSGCNLGLTTDHSSVSTLQLLEGGAAEQTKMGISPVTLAVLMLASQPSLVRLQDPGNTNTRLFTGNQALDSGAVGFGLGVGAAVVGSSLLNNQNHNNPCGKRRRRRNAQDTRFFLGNNNNCNYPSSNTQYPSNNYGSSSNTYYPSNNFVSSSNTYPSNNYPSNNYVSSSNTYPSNNYPSNNYVSSSNSYPSTNYGSSCQCTQLSFTDHQGNVNGKCQR